MTAASLEPIDVLTYFLRATVTEPTRSGVSPTTRVSSSTHSTTGNGSTTMYVVTNTPLSAVTSVTVAAAPLTEYVDYTVDVPNNTVIFTTAPANLAAIVINYRYGTNWIYGDEARDDLAKSSYPRVFITPLDENEIQKQGLGETDTYDNALIQIDVLAYKDMICTVNGTTREGPNVAASIARDIRNQLRTYLNSKIGVKLFNPVLLSKRPVPYEEPQGVYRHLIEVRLEAFNLGT